MQRRQFVRLLAAAFALPACAPAAPPASAPAPAAPPPGAPTAPPPSLPTPLPTAAATAVPSFTPSPTLQPAPRPTTAPADPAVALARATLARMTLEQKVGQLFMLGFEGTSVNDSNRALVAGKHLGGVTLFGRNVQHPSQVAALLRGLQQIANPVPLFVSVDQEGGLVARFSQGTTIFPGAMALGATGDVDLERQVAAASARELLAMGVNMNLAPVVDVNTNPHNPVIGTRAFGSDPQVVGRFGVATVEGLQGEGVSAVAKHFPGHGDTAVDSHLDLPVVAHARDRLLAVELAPFRAAVAAGVDAVMTAHVYLPSVEPRQNVSATLSAAVLGGLLRQELGFQGLVLTDALDMRAITRDRTAADAAVEAFLAGADMLLIAGIEEEDRRQLERAPGVMLDAVRAGRVSEVRLDESVLRILLAKARRGILPGTTGRAAPALEEVGSARHRALALDVARRAVTLVRPGALTLPIARETRVLVVQASHPTRSLVEEPDLPSNLAAAIRGFAPNVLTADSRDAQAAARVASGADAVVLATYDLARDARQQALAQALVDAGKPLAVVTLRGPYDAAALPANVTVLAVYGDRPVHLRAAAEALFGALRPTGQLPVQLQ